VAVPNIIRFRLSPYQIPYVWRLTNTCIAADLADPKLIGEMESGQTLLLEVVDSSVLTVSTSLPLNQFAAVRQGAPTQVFEQASMSDPTPTRNERATT
jgi:Invasion associated locus B (IalB) protein